MFVKTNVKSIVTDDKGKVKAAIWNGYNIILDLSVWMAIILLFLYIRWLFT